MKRIFQIAMEMGRVAGLCLPIVLVALPALCQSENDIYDRRSGEIKLATIARWHGILKRENQVRISFFLPENLRPTNDGMQVASRVLGHALENALRDSAFFSTGAWFDVSSQGRTASDQAQIAAQGDGDGAQAQNVNFNMHAARAVATLEHKGYFNTRFSYRALTQTFSFEVSKSLSANSHIVFTHVDNAFETADRVGFRFSW